MFRELAINLAESTSEISHPNLPPNEMPYHIQQARRQDVDALTDLLISSFYTPFDGMTRWLYPLLYFGIREDLRGRLRSQKPYYACLVATHAAHALNDTPVSNTAVAPSSSSGLILGTVEIALKQTYPWQIQPSDSLYISNLAVRAGYRRQGVAQALLQQCEQMARTWRFQFIYLHVLETNVKARSLYRKLDYRHHAVDSGLGSWLWGQPERLLLQKKLLS
ncbi:MAG: GNAT family N-acetyltransferase [Thainema sp.]